MAKFDNETLLEWYVHESLQVETYWYAEESYRYKNIQVKEGMPNINHDSDKKIHEQEHAWLRDSLISMKKNKHIRIAILLFTMCCLM